MTHLNRILMQKTSTYPFHPFSAVFPGSSAAFVSSYFTKTYKQKIHPQDGKFSVSKANAGKSAEKFGKMSHTHEKVSQSYSKGKRIVTGIAVAPSCVGWAVFDMVEKDLLEFESENLETKLTGSLTCSLPQIYCTVRDLKDKIPQSDFYIMESYKYRPIRTLLETEIQILSVLYTILNSESESSNWKLIFQKRSVIDNMFGLSIGRERVSTHQKLQRMFNDLELKNYRSGKIELPDMPHLSNFKIGKEFLDFIYNPGAPFLEKESCCTAFLLTVSFIEINKTKMKLTDQPENN